MLDPRKMKQLMKQMDMEEMDASEVVIKTSKGNIVISSPKVTKMNMMGQESYQVIGHGQVEEATPEVSEDDLEMVQEQAGVSAEEAREALESAGGDIAAAILTLKK